MTRALAAAAVSVIVLASAGAALAQPPSDTQRIEAAGLSKDLEIARLKIEREQLSVRLRQLDAQLGALSAAFDALLKSDAQRAGQALDAELKPTHDAIVKALGGDPAKGDTFDFAARTLVKKEPPKDMK